MNTTSAPTRRVEATATVSTDTRAPGYNVAVNGEIVVAYLVAERTAAPAYLQLVPRDATYLVGFAADDDPGFWWGELGGAATHAEAEELLAALTDERPGQEFITPVPSA